jgi:hypothetical protein
VPSTPSPTRRASPLPRCRGSTPSVPLSPTHSFELLRQRRLISSPASGSREITQRPQRPASSFCSDERFDTALRDRCHLSDRTATISDGHEFAGGGLGHDLGRVLPQCANPDFRHVLQCSTLGGSAAPAFSRAGPLGRAISTSQAGSPLRSAPKGLSTVEDPTSSPCRDVFESRPLGS